MSIFLDAPREPLAPAPAEDGSETAVARGDTYHPLVRELERYAQGHILGRSFLISGHRGSGKTTLVRQAIEDVSKRRMKAEGRDNPTSGRPFPIELHGPNLLDPRFRNPRMLASADGERSAEVVESHTSSPARCDVLATEQMLSQITVALYRALAREFGQAYGKCLEHRIAKSRIYPPRMLELAGQLTLELDDGPSPAVLREFWRQVDALESGVLFEDPDQRPRDQGVREVVALASAASAYRRVSGVYEGGGTRETGSLSAEQEQRAGGAAGEATRQVDLRASINNVLGLLAGLAAGAGVYWQDEPDGFLAAAVGLATALVTAFGLQRVQIQRRNLTREYTFIRDHSISTLDRELPNLIQRIRQAGLSPVFVVDELDKIRKLPTAMSLLVQHLKHFVTERCFFCFLTDRDYFERLREMRTSGAYCKEYTYFTEHLFVTYRPTDLHEYLRTILKSDQDGKAEKADLDLLRYALLYRARLHPFDIQTAIAQLFEENGRLRPDPGDLRSYRYHRFNIQIQFAIECLIETGELRERLDEDPYFWQLAYDALYYPTRQWEQDQEVDLSPRVFADYLDSRRERPDAEAHNGGRDAGLGESAPQPSYHAEPGSSSPVSRDAELLREQVRELCEILSEPEPFAEIEKKRRRPLLPREVVNAMQGAGGALLRRVTDDRYVWNFDMYGRDLRATAVAADDTAAQVAFIETVNSAVREFSGDKVDLEALADDYGVLSTTPAWSTVEAAIARINDPEAEADERQAELDREAIGEFAWLLENTGKTIGETLVLAADIGRVVSQGDSPERFERGLGALSELLDLPSIAGFKVEAALRSACEALDLTDLAELRLAKQAPDRWRDRVSELLQSRPELISSAQIEAYRAEGWKLWRERLDLLLRDGRTSFAPKAADLYCSAARRSPSSLLRLDLERMTLAQWSEAVRLSLEDIAAQEMNSAPVWLAIPALLQLGLGSGASALIEALKNKKATSPYLRRALADDEIELAEGWLEIGKTRRRPACCIVSKPRSPLTANWRCSNRFGALHLDQEQWRSSKRVLDELVGWLAQKLDLRLVMVEVGDQREPPSAPPLTAWRDLPVVYLVPKDLKLPDLPTSAPQIVAPRSFEAAFNQSLRQI